MELNLLLYRSELKKKIVYNYIFYGIIVGLVEDKTINRDELLKLYIDTFGVPKGFENVIAISRENEIKNLIFYEMKNKGTSILKKKFLKISCEEVSYYQFLLSSSKSLLPVVIFSFIYIYFLMSYFL